MLGKQQFLLTRPMWGDRYRGSFRYIMDWSWLCWWACYLLRWHFNSPANHSWTTKGILVEAQVPNRSGWEWKRDDPVAQAALLSEHPKMHHRAGDTDKAWNTLRRYTLCGAWTSSICILVWLHNYVDFQPSTSKSIAVISASVLSRKAILPTNSKAVAISCCGKALLRTQLRPDHYYGWGSKRN